MGGTLHLVKLCVGVEHPDELIEWQDRRRRETGRAHAFHITRMWPKRAEELLAGGSLYWVMKGEIKARQQILRLEPVDSDDGITRCAIILDPDVVKTERAPRRAFQGWRYLDATSAPADLDAGTTANATLPDSLAHALVELGVK